MKAKRTTHAAQIRAEYNFDYSKAVRGKYYKRLVKDLRSMIKSKRQRRVTARSA